jgi:hypothetical protein
MSVKANPEVITLERLERALAAISYAIMLDGPVYAPIMERLEREIAAWHAKDDVMSRAQQHLAQFKAQAAIDSGAVKAIV